MLWGVTLCIDAGLCPLDITATPPLCHDIKSVSRHCQTFLGTESPLRKNHWATWRSRGKSLQREEPAQTNPAAGTKAEVGGVQPAKLGVKRDEVGRAPVQKDLTTTVGSDSGI